MKGRRYSVSNQEIKEYWDGSLANRITTRGFECNGSKLIKILNFLKKIDLKGKTKLEIGCGACHLAMKLKLDKYTGLDISSVGYDFVKKHLLTDSYFVNSSIEEYQTDNKYDVIMAFDSLEHINLNKNIADKINSLSKSNSIFIGNIPLVNSSHKEKQGIEYEMDFNKLWAFLHSCGYPTIMSELYYTETKPSNGRVYHYPFLLFYGRRCLR